MKPSDFLTELSTEKLAQYKTAAAADASKADKEKDFARGNKRFSGIVKATKKQFANDEKKVEESVGLPYPGTYEETNDMFKTSGQRRIGSLTTEDEQIDGMAQGEIREIIKNAVYIKNQLDKGVSLDGWMYSYVTTSNDHLNSVAEQINNPHIDEEDMGEGWSQKYKDSINCNNPKGFSQKAHCAGKKKHNEDMSEEKKPDFMKAGNMKPFKASGEEIPGAVHALEKLLLKAKEQGVKLNYNNIDKIMQSVCKKHNLTGDELHNEFVSKHHMIPDNWIVKQLDEACWKGYHKEGNKKMFGKTYPNCVKNEGVAEGSEDSAEKYKAHLLKTAPRIMDFLAKTVKGWRPSEQEMLGAIDTAYTVMKHTGDVRQAGKAMMDELNTLHRMSQGQQGVAEGSDELYQKAIRKYVQQVAHDYLGGGNAHLYGANKFDADMFGVSREQAKQDFKTLFPQAVNQLQGVAEGSSYNIDQDDHDEFTPDEIVRIKNSHFPDTLRDNLRAAKKEARRAKHFSSSSDGGDSKLGSPVGSASDNTYEGVTEGSDSNLSYQGNCTEDDVIEHIFGDVNNFANMVEEHGDEFTVGDLVVKYDPETDVHSFYYKKQGVAEEKCPHCGGVMVSEELMNEKKDACYYKVKSRYKVWPSAYASGALVKCRKSHGNWGNGSKNESSILEGLEQVDENLHQWFKEKWVRFGPDGKIRGACARGDDSEGKPKCLPQSKAQNLGKKGRASAASRKRREDPNPERHGKAINVATKKESAMSTGLNQVDEGWKSALAGVAMAGLGALGGAGHAQAADLSGFNTQYLQQVASGEHPRPMVSIDDAKAELQAREQGKQQTVAPAAKPETSSGYSIDYLKKAADPDRIGRYLISVEKAQEMLNQATAPRARPALNIAPGDYPAAK